MRPRSATATCPGRLIAEHLSATAFDVTELLEPGYEPARLRQTLEDVGARPKRKR